VSSTGLTTTPVPKHRCGGPPTREPATRFRRIMGSLKSTVLLGYTIAAYDTDRMSHLDEQERAAVARLIGDGTYRRLADAVAAEDPEIADQ
jgi:hypothetical protein